MFWISVLFLANTAMLIVLWVDVPRVSEAYLNADVTSHRDPAEDERHLAAVAVDLRAIQISNACLILAIVLWPVFLLEFLFYSGSSIDGRRFTRTRVLACLCPPLRMGTPNLEMRGRIWLPKFGWTRPTASVRQDLEKLFGMPMIAIALMILPILLVEFGLKEHVADRNWLRILLHLSTGTIWFAFALEFIVMYSVAKKKLQYCKTHWLDLAIVLLPLLSFLRSLRVLRATRLARLAKLQYLTRLGRVYRLRGLTIKAFRGLAVIEVMHRILPMTLERQVELLKEDLADHERHGRELRKKIASIEQLIESRRSEAPSQDAGTVKELEQPVDEQAQPVAEPAQQAANAEGAGE